MSKIEKLLDKLQTKPKDFTYREIRTILEHFGFYENNKGKTSGSTIEYKNANGTSIGFHKSHNRKNMRRYEIELILEVLKKEGII